MIESEKLNRIEEMLEHLLKQQMIKEYYSTAEVADILDRAEYTVREWCRERKVRARKAPNGRGWLIPHDELERLRNHGMGANWEQSGKLR